MLGVGTSINCNAPAPFWTAGTEVALAAEDLFLVPVQIPVCSDLWVGGSVVCVSVLRVVR